jgi:hypothetical protein
MQRYEYCALTLNLFKGSAEIVFYKRDGNHVKVPRLDKQQLSSQEREAMIGQILAEMGDLGWQMTGVINGAIFYFIREME